MPYDKTIDYLFGLQGSGIKLGLDNIKALLKRLGEVAGSFNSVHIAGTNGKGSTAACLAALLQCPDHITGLFTSPHLLSFTERIRVDGVEVTEGDVVELAAKVREAAGELNPTFFEVVTAMAYVHFRSCRVRWAVIEAGLGGRLDSTNTLTPRATIITPVGLDHAEFLGNTLASVAHEKAGIIKEGVPLVLAAQEPEALDVILKRARELGAPVHRAGVDFSATVTGRSPSGTGRGSLTLDYSDDDRTINGIEIPLTGDYQAGNAALAIRAFALLAHDMPPETFEAAVRERTGLIRWHGRLEQVAEDPPVYIDGAHNPQAARALAGELSARPLSGTGMTLVLGVMRDKDIKGIIGPLLPLAGRVICTAPAYGRATPPGELADICARMGHEAEAADTVARAMESARADGKTVLVAGSFFTAGEALEALGAKGVLTRLRECAR